MYGSRFTRMTDEAQQRELVARVGAAQVVTVDPDGWPQATLLPVIWDGDRLVMHAAARNPHFADLVGRSVPALAVVTGPNAYVSPTWYPSRTKRGVAVPTWNYLVVQFRGTLTGYADRDRMRAAVTALSDVHEAHRPDPWTVESAPEYLVEGLLHGIIGLELTVTSVQGKAKTSRNRVLADRLGVIDGLRAEPADTGNGPHALAELMARDLADP